MGRLTQKIKTVQLFAPRQTVPQLPTAPVVAKVTKQSSIEILRATRQHVYSSQDDGVTAAFAQHATVYNVYPWVQKAIRVIAEPFSAAPLNIVKLNGEVIEGHEIATLLAYGNDQQGPEQLWYEYIVNMMLGGESFIEFVLAASGRKVVEWWMRRPDKVGIFPDKTQERTYYPRPAAYWVEDDKNLLDAQHIWHNKFFNPINPWRGIAPITAVREGIAIDMFAQAWSKRFLKDNARPDYAIIAPEGLTPTEKQEVIDEILAQHRGGSHLPLILEKGIADIKPFSFAPKDIEWLEQRKFSRDEVGAIFGVPDEVMGYGRDTYENMDAAFRWLWLLTIKPLADKRDMALTRHLRHVLPLLKPDERIKTDFKDVSVLQDNLSPKLDQAAQLFAMGVPFNVINDTLGLGIGEVPGGEVGYIPMSLIPAEMARNRVLPVTQQTTTATAAMPMLFHLAVSKGIAYGSEEHQKLWKQHDDRLLPLEAKMMRMLKKEFQRQQIDVLRRLRSFYETTRQSALTGETKATQVIPTLPDLFVMADETNLVRQAFATLFNDAVNQFGEYAMLDLGIGIVFDIYDPLVVDAARLAVFTFARDINQTTSDAIQSILQDILIEATEQGLSISETQSLIYDNISARFDIRKRDYETERIARTEINRVANNGTLHGWRQSGVVVGKSWLAAIDDRTRETHITAHNEYNQNPIPINANFIVGGYPCLHPGETGQAGEDINCRCSMIAALS